MATRRWATALWSSSRSASRFICQGKKKMGSLGRNTDRAVVAASSKNLESQSNVAALAPTTTIQDDLTATGLQTCSPQFGHVLLPLPKEPKLSSNHPSWPAFKGHSSRLWGHVLPAGLAILLGTTQVRARISNNVQSVCLRRNAIWQATD